MDSAIRVTDLVRPFQLETSQLRGRIVRLDDSLNRCLSSHNYPPAVAELLAELLLLAAGFSGALKYEGTFSLQVRGSGNPGLLVAELRDQKYLRGYASYNGGSRDDGKEVMPHMGDGVLAITMDQRPAGGELYQGIVNLNPDSLRSSMLGYFEQSEQIPTSIRLALRFDPLGRRWSAAAVILQAMPGEGGVSARERGEDWQRSMILLDSITDDELLDMGIAVDQLLFRLFHEEGVRVFEPHDVDFACRCSEERVKNLLAQFSKAEIQDMVKDDGYVHVNCEFCGRAYKFGELNIQ